MSTPHISAEKGDFARTVIMPGDPHRSELIAREFLSGALLVNDVRGVRGFTGEYKGVRVSVMASGMGMPSMSIYSHELYNCFGVENIIRTGSAGALSDSLALRDIVICDNAITDSGIVRFLGAEPMSDIPASRELAEIARFVRTSARTVVGRLQTSDVFYSDNVYKLEWKARGALAVEMETAALYATALKAEKRALALCTVSDYALTGEGLSAAEREKTFTDMIEIALETAVEAERLPKL